MFNLPVAAVSAKLVQASELAVWVEDLILLQSFFRIHLLDLHLLVSETFLGQTEAVWLEFKNLRLALVYSRLEIH